MGQASFEVESQGGTAKIKIIGTIDEDVDASQFPSPSEAAVEVHLGGIKSINSCGIREWIKWVSSLNGKTLTFFECPKVIIDQVNMVQGFLPTNGKVMSFFVPYYNDDSGEEKNVLFRYGAEFTDEGVVLPQGIVDSQGSEMEMDVVEAKYFKFLKKG